MILDLLKSELNKAEVSVIQSLNQDGEEVNAFRIDGDNGNFDCYAICMEEENLFVLFSDLKIKVPEKKRPAVLEKLNEINTNLKYGMFLLEKTDHTIVFRLTSYIDERSQSAHELMHQLIGISAAVLDGFYSEIGRSVLGEA